MKASSEAAKPAEVYTYIVDVTDASGNPVAGVGIVLVCENGYTSVKTTNARGRVSFEVADGNWTAALEEVPEGYMNSTADRYEFTNRKVVIVLK